MASATDRRGSSDANGSWNTICTARRNVVGLMPHPERACEPSLGSADGRIVLESAVRAFASGVAAGQSPA